MGRSSHWARGEPRWVPVAAWVGQRLWTLRTATGPAVEQLDFPDARLELGRRRLRDDTRWAALESALNQRPGRVYALATDRVHVESTSASADVRVPEEGRCPLGHRKDHRPDLPPVHVRPAGREPLAMPRAPDGVSGARAEDPRYLPCIARGQARGGRRGRL
jgi:transposase